MPLPTGTVTFLFSDIEGSTRHARRLEPATWMAALEAHDRLADAVVQTHRGAVVKHEGDGVFAVFSSAPDAVAAAAAFQRSLAADGLAGLSDVRVRIGLHTGDGTLTAAGDDYVGVDVHYAARVAGAANGGQIALSDSIAPLVADRLLAGTHLEDTGLARLKDFDEPRRLHRLVIPGAADDPRPLRALGPPSNLPRPISTFVGRDTELSDVLGLLRLARLVTLTGPGGSGKTRLALAAAERLTADLPDGCWFVPLAAVEDAALVPSAIATALAIEEEVGRPIADTLRASLQERQLLLVLDNFEQVVAGAGFVAGLLSAARGLRALITSREILRVAGEQEYRVPPLAGLDAVSLFVERARAVRPGFTVTDDNATAVAAICERLDNLPLAIELAAARSRLFAPQALLARLERSLDVLTSGTRDLPERQRTLRGAIAWSHDLLDAMDQTLFRRLAVFAGGWTIESAEAVCDPTGELGPPVVDGLLSLVEKSLVVEAPTEHGEPRFHLLQTVREFARERLTAAGEGEALERQHAEYFVALAEHAEPVLEYGDPGDWLDRLAHERDNIRATLEWSLRTGELELGMRLAGAAWRYWHHRSHLREGRDWCRRLLDAPAAFRPTAARFKALTAAGGLAYWLADYAAAKSCYEEALAIAATLEDDGLRADALHSLGYIDVVEGNLESLRERHTEAARLFEARGDRLGHAKVRQGLVLVSFLEGDWRAARQLAEEDVVFQREIGSLARAADSETLVAAASIHLGELDVAVAHLRAALQLELDLNLTVAITGSLITGAVIAVNAGEYVRAAQIAGAAQELRDSSGSSAAPMDVLHLPDPAALARAALGEAAFLEATQAGRRLPLSAAVELALAVPVQVSRAASADPLGAACAT